MAKVARNVSGDAHVLDVRGRLAVKRDIAEQAGETEKVLVLKPRGTAPLEHLNRQAVRTRANVLSEVKLGRRKRIRGIAHVGAVEPQHHGALGSGKGDG